MTELQADNNSWEDVELLIRAAGDYVCPSDDLRPRVIESAKQERTERRGRFYLGRVALLFALLFLVTYMYPPDTSSEMNPFMREFTLTSTGSREASTDAGTRRIGAEDWRLIDAFTKLRRQQAQLLKFEI